jgi:hypothetical protein
MSAPIDVLAVMDRLIAGIEHEQRVRVGKDDIEGARLLECTRRDSIAARAAAAELIEAIKEGFAFMVKPTELPPAGRRSMPSVARLNDRKKASYYRIHEAIIRVGGAP